MDRVAQWSTEDRADLFREAGAEKGMHPAIVEKDFWVCWVLGRLFASETIAPKILFKGGTSLSKVFGLIERFSEDIDLILDWNEVTGDDPEADRSRTKQDGFNKEIRIETQRYLMDDFLPAVQIAVGDTCSTVIEDNPEIILLRYPASFSLDYLRAEILLEIGPLALWIPNAEYWITPYAAEALPDVFDKPLCRVRAIKAERSFWEKITILHHEAHRPDDNAQPRGYSRHYYDVSRMAKSPLKTVAFEQLDLLASVVAFKDKFYPRGWAKYDLAKPGTTKLVPPDLIRRSLDADYAGMRQMIYGEYPAFSDILADIAQLESEINNLDAEA